MTTADISGATSPVGEVLDGGSASSEVLVAEVLLARVAVGDVAAFGHLYGQLHGKVFGVAVRLLIDRHQAQEVAQEAWLQIWQQAARFDPRSGSAGGWVMRIAHARAVDRIRSANACRVRDTAAAAGDHLVAFDVVVDAVLSSAEQGKLRERLPQLSDKQRESIDLAYFGGLSVPAISELLAVPLGTVKTRIRDGLIHLRKIDGPAGDRCVGARQQGLGVESPLDCTVPVTAHHDGPPAALRSEAVEPSASATRMRWVSLRWWWGTECLAPSPLVDAPGGHVRVPVITRYSERGKR